MFVFMFFFVFKFFLYKSIIKAGLFKASSIKVAEFYLSNFDVIVYCTDWSTKAESTGNTDNLRVEISSLEFS